MSALKVVLLAINLATRRREEAGQVLVQAHQTWGNAQDQLEQLESYAAGTESKWAVSAQLVSSADALRNYYQFMGRLQQAIALQRQAVAKLQRELVAAKKGLLDAEIRIASLNQLLEKKQSVIDRLQAGREQKQQDEFAATQHRRLRADLDTLGAS